MPRKSFPWRPASSSIPLKTTSAMVVCVLNTLRMFVVLMRGKILSEEAPAKSRWTPFLVSRSHHVIPILNYLSSDCTLFAIVLRILPDQYSVVKFLQSGSTSFHQCVKNASEEAINVLITCHCWR